MHMARWEDEWVGDAKNGWLDLWVPVQGWRRGWVNMGWESEWTRTWGMLRNEYRGGQMGAGIHVSETMAAGRGGGGGYRKSG